MSTHSEATARTDRQTDTTKTLPLPHTWEVKIDLGQGMHDTFAPSRSATVVDGQGT